MKIFEKLFELFLIFAQFIHIDAIVGGYESQKHGNALIKRLINNLEFLLIRIVLYFGPEKCLKESRIT